MNILALDTSSRACSCALLRDGVLAGEFFANLGLTHSQTSMPMVEALLAHCRVRLEEIDLFAVSTGPGSFTGLRIGLSSVKGMAFALDKPCAAVPTLHALAANCPDFQGVVVPCMDARRGQVYTARFRCGNGGIERLSEDEALPVAELEIALRALAPEPVLLVGDGAAMCCETLGDLVHVRLAAERSRHQRASSVAWLAAELAARGETVTAEALAPRYLRLPQAERERLARMETASEHEEESR